MAIALAPLENGAEFIWGRTRIAPHAARSASSNRTVGTRLMVASRVGVKVDECLLRRALGNY